MDLPASHFRHLACQKCVQCNKLSVYRGVQGDDGLLWPASLPSPTVYYMLRERQLAFNIVAAEAHPASVWRRHSVADGRINALLLRRNLPQLTLSVPLSCGGVQQGDTAVYLGPVQPLLLPIKALVALASARQQQAAFAARRLSSLQRFSTPPPQLKEHPAKRARLADSYACPAYPTYGHFLAPAQPPAAGDWQAATAMVITIPPAAASSYDGRGGATAGTPATGVDSGPLAELLRKMRGIFDAAPALSVY